MSPNYVTLIVILIAWLGIFLYLLRFDKRVKKLEKK